MPVIKIHVEEEEYAPIRRFAGRLSMQPEDIAYAGLNRIMLLHADEGVGTDIKETHDWKKQNLPLWADSARSVHAYEGKHDDYSEPSI
jgi:hypothetical protein